MAQGDVSGDMDVSGNMRMLPASAGTNRRQPRQLRGLAPAVPGTRCRLPFALHRIRMAACTFAAALFAPLFAGLHW